MLSTRSSRHRRRNQGDTSPQDPGELKNSKRQHFDPDSPKGLERSIERDVWDSFREEHIDCVCITFL